MTAVQDSWTDGVIRAALTRPVGRVHDTLSDALTPDHLRGDPESLRAGAATASRQMAGARIAIGLAMGVDGGPTPREGPIIDELNGCAQPIRDALELLGGDKVGALVDEGDVRVAVSLLARAHILTGMFH